MIYLASPYSDPNPSTQRERYWSVCKAAARLIAEGSLVFSPIAHSHGIAAFGLPGEYQFWQEFDVKMINVCDRFAVLKLPGWKESIGVRAEMMVANNLGRTIIYYPESYGV